LAARSDHRPARHCFSLAPSRLLGNLGIRLMSPLARRRQDQGRGLRAYSPNEPRELLWGAPRIHGELLKLGFVVSQATVSRYMPRRGYPPTQRWRTFLRNQAFANGAIGFGEAGRLPDVVRGWIMRVAGAPPRCGMASLAGLSSHRRPCTRCGHITLPIVQIGASRRGVACPAPPRSSPQIGPHSTWPVDDFHRIAQGHHRDASWPAFANCTRSSAIARRAKRPTIP